MASSAPSSSSNPPFMSLDPFAHRQFPQDGNPATGIPIVGCTKEDFIKKANELYEEMKKSSKPALVDGYAPFCKHIFIPNFTQTQVAYAKISEENKALLKSEYKARRKDELAVLTRWFPKDDVKVGVAKYLDLILYSREQIESETKAMTGKTGETSPDASPWGIISIKPQDVDYETPMQPITIMRNALSMDEGGSGKSLDKKKYAEAVAFWKEHANVL